MLADHLGSTSLVTDTNGNRTSELRYKPWGETRFSFGTMPTKYTFTGQFSYTDDPSTPQMEGFGLMYYNARWYDPYLNRFTQPDSIVPLASQGTQAWDRYAFVNNNPVRYNDPTGHTVNPCPMCQLWALALASVNNAIGPNATGFWELAARGVLQANAANIVGQGLAQLKRDPAVTSFQNETLDKIMSNSQYGQNAFTPNDKSDSVYVGDHGNTIVNLFDENNWMVHAGTMTATNMNVSKDGKITTTWQISDNFDFRSDWSDHTTRTGLAYWKYNISAALFGDFLYHGIFGATDDLSTTATWYTTLCPVGGDPDSHELYDCSDPD